MLPAARIRLTRRATSGQVMSFPKYFRIPQETSTAAVTTKSATLELECFAPFSSARSRISDKDLHAMVLLPGKWVA